MMNPKNFFLSLTRFDFIKFNVGMDYTSLNSSEINAESSLKLWIKEEIRNTDWIYQVPITGLFKKSLKFRSDRHIRDLNLIFF